jgi:hypothetical protein
MIFRYVAHHRVLDYAMLGWSIADTLANTPYSRFDWYRRRNRRPESPPRIALTS